MTRPRRTITCVRCGQERLHQARGLCSTCYEYSREHGTLDEYSTVGRGPKTQQKAPSRRLTVCVSCGEYREHSAWGLCSRCYKAARLGGTLDQYAPTPPQIRTTDEAAAHNPALAAFLRERRRRISRRARLNTINTRRRTP